MSRERYVILGLARARAEWFRRVGQWSTSAAIPAEFVKCVSTEEVAARLAGGRPFSALLVEGALPRVDRDLIADAREAGCVVLVVDDGRSGRNWIELGAATVLPPTFGRELLLDALVTHARLVGAGDDLPHDEDADLPTFLERGEVVAVLGPGGTGASTVAIALAQGLCAGDANRSVVLADLCRNAEQAMLHDSGDIIPGLQDLIEAHRLTTLAAPLVRELTYDVETRGYRLLLGLRRARYWSAFRPRALEAAFDSLSRAFDVVVCDVDADLEGEDQGGSVDVEERNLLARLPVARADVVLAVGSPGLKGLYSLVRVIADLLAFGVPPRRVLPVIDHAPRKPRARGELSAALGELLAGVVGSQDLSGPLYLPVRRVEEALRDGAPLPDPLPRLVAGAYRAVLGRSGAARAAPAEPERVKPGSLGSFAAHPEADS